MGVGVINVDKERLERFALETYRILAPLVIDGRVQPSVSIAHSSVQAAIALMEEIDKVLDAPLKSKGGQDDQE